MYQGVDIRLYMLDHFLFFFIKELLYVGPFSPVLYMIIWTGPFFPITNFSLLKITTNDVNGLTNILSIAITLPYVFTRKNPQNYVLSVRTRAIYIYLYQRLESRCLYMKL